MPENNSISREDMRGFLDFLSKERRLVGPVDTGKVIEYREASATDILIDDRITYNSAKAYYFPQTELMFTFADGEVEDNVKIPGYVIFGAKPCDLEALRVMNAVYTTGKYEDPFFQRRHEANLIIGVGCRQQKPECFCAELGVDKEFSDFCDIMLKDDGDQKVGEDNIGGFYTVEFLSDKGKKALKSYPATSEIVCDNERKVTVSNANNETEEPSPCLIDSLKLDVNKEDADYFDIIDWKKVTETCKGCGICTYICPTCYCFDFKDVSKKGIAERYKCWDSCMYPKFTLHASGHNPRENRHERYRQRVLHKYKYVPNNFDGAVACTGCGRCVRGCPVGMNIKDITRQIIDNDKSKESKPPSP